MLPEGRYTVEASSPFRLEPDGEAVDRTPGATLTFTATLSKR